MRQIYIIILTSIFTFNINAQSIEKELQYLKIVNNQSKSLIKDNLRNAELSAFKMIQNPDSFKMIGAEFFQELAKSYFLAEMYEHTLLSFYRQRCFFPQKNNSETAQVYNNAAEQTKKIEFKTFTNQYNNTNIEKVPASYKKRFVLFLKTIYQLSFKKTEHLEIEYSNLYRSLTQEEIIPDWIRQEAFYVKIGIKAKDRSSMYNFNEPEKNIFFPTFLSEAQKKMICKKAMCYYRFKNKGLYSEYLTICKAKN